MKWKTNIHTEIYAIFYLFKFFLSKILNNRSGENLKTVLYMDREKKLVELEKKLKIEDFGELMLSAWKVI